MKKHFTINSSYFMPKLFFSFIFMALSFFIMSSSTGAQTQDILALDVTETVVLLKAPLVGDQTTEIQKTLPQILKNNPANPNAQDTALKKDSQNPDSAPEKNATLPADSPPSEATPAPSSPVTLLSLPTALKNISSAKPAKAAPQPRKKVIAKVTPLPAPVVLGTQTETSSFRTFLVPLTTSYAYMNDKYALKTVQLLALLSAFCVASGTMLLLKKQQSLSLKPVKSNDDLSFVE